MRFKLSESEGFTGKFLLMARCPWSSKSPAFVWIPTALCSHLEGSTDLGLTKGGEVTDNYGFLPSMCSSSLSPLPLFSNTCSRSFSICSPLFSFSFFCPLLCPHSHSISPLHSSHPAISCSWTVLYGQFTGRGIHSPFSP